MSAERTAALTPELTEGERLLGRPLAKEKRSGVEHYVPGQMQAVRWDGREYGTDRACEIGRITYVDVMGHACVVLAFRYLNGDTDWFATWAGRAGQTWQSEAKRLDPGDFTLSEKMLAALAAAPVEEDESDA